MNLLVGVNAEFYKYFLTGEPYSEHWQAEWEYLYSLVKDHPNDGSFGFLPKPAENSFSSWELGAIRVSSSIHPDGMRYVQMLPAISIKLNYDKKIIIIYTTTIYFTMIETTCVKKHN